MKSIIQTLCLLGLVLVSIPLLAQPVCDGPDVEVLETQCSGSFLWEATIDVSQGDSDCDFFIDPVTGDSLAFGVHTFGPFSQQGVNLLFSCNFLDSCWTFVDILAPVNWPCNTQIECGIEFGYFVDTVNATCGLADGEASFVLTATEDYSITLTDQNGQPISQSNNSVFVGLGGGNYNYQIFCANGEEAFSGEFLISETSAFNASIVANTNDCSTISLAAQASLPGIYTYAWSNGETTPSITVTSGNSYWVVITDDQGCEDFASIQLDSIQIMQINTFPFDEICNYANGGVWGSISGGVAPYIVEWSDGFNGGISRQDLAAGVYQYTVTDATGCASVSEVEINSVDLQFEVQVGLLCEGSAQMIVYPMDSISSMLTYLWTAPDGTVISTENSAVTTQTGEHTIVVTDENGCSGTQVVTVQEGQQSGISASIQSVTFSDTISSGCDQWIALIGDGPLNPWYPAYWQVPGQTWQVYGSSIDPNVYGAGLYVATHYPQGSSCPVVDSVLITPEDLECGNVSGTAYLNLDNDCSFQDGDIILQGQQIVFENTSTGDLYYAFTDFGGEYSISLPAGSYSIDISGGNDLLALCNPVGFSLLSGQNIQDVNVPVVGTESCPRVEVNVFNPLLRRCFDSPVYINYVNTGTVVAEDVVLTIEVGDFASEVEDWVGVSADAIVTDPVTGITTATFNLGDIAPFDGGQRSLSVYSCSNDFPLGAAGCITATVSPNNPCPPADPAWTGASLRVEGDCQGDSINFTVSNVGDADMSVPLSYIVIEDGVLLTPQPQVANPVSAGSSEVFTFPADGSTYHFQIEQEPLHPGLEMPIDFVEACGNGQATYGIALQFPLSDDAYWIDEECNELIGAYDPNDKRAMPRGYGENRYVEAGEMIDYTIRFQNTGTDTAFNIIVRDTLSEVFDLSTLEITGATHDMYTRVDSSGRALAFFFDNIMLPDSFVNERASHGAVTLRLRTLEDLTPGTDVDNGAAIYFDFNEPIFTNVYDLEIAEDFVTVGLFDFTSEVAQLKVFPNPTAGAAMIELPEALKGQQLQLEVFDLLGRKQVNYNYQAGDQPRVDLGQLPAGWYTLRLSEGGKALGTGRVLLQR